ncbi:MAG: hypothetical protein ACD_9C00236G0004 [uncultured bacterium]|nr:MAG: hypothetical protein ACD_9C00236G0004 [uncultured bacterium]
MKTQNNALELDKDGQSGAQDFFLYLVTFLSLGFVAFGEGSILYGFINKFVADKESNLFPVFNQGSVKFGIAALVIAGPIFFIISRIITRRIAEKRIPLESTVRKWLTYIVLFFASATIIGDLITLVVNFLGGDFTASFLLKVLVVLSIAGGIFGYYFWDMRRTEVSSGINKIAMLACMIVVAVTFVAGFFIIDSPTVSRQKNIDQQTVNNLQMIDSSIQNYFSETGKLPQKLEDLQSTKFSVGTPTIKSITYKVQSAETYNLCGDFQRSSLIDESSQNEAFVNDWKHDGGTFCFNRIALKKVDVPQSVTK